MLEFAEYADYVERVQNRPGRRRRPATLNEDDELVEPDTDETEIDEDDEYDERRDKVDGQDDEIAASNADGSGEHPSDGPAVKRHKASADNVPIERQINTVSKPNNLFVCEKSLLLFVGEDNAQVKQDVTNSLILAQLNADKHVQDFKTNAGSAPFVLESLKEWFAKFQESFHHFNWVDIGFDVAELKSSGNDLSV